MSSARNVAGILLGTGAFSASLYLAYHWQCMELQFQKRLQEMPANYSFAESPTRNRQFEQVAHCYDNCIGRDETVMGINMMRRILLYYNASGNVLEVGAGTARNLTYYPSHVKGIVLTDASENMLSQAKQKVAKIFQSPQTTTRRLAVLQADAAALDLPDNSFDTVVDTFGLCSYNDPVQVLNEMARVCKPTGKILLLEHGRSRNWDTINKFLDRHVEQHAANWGCVFNRSIDEIANEANVEIDTIRTFHFGTTYYIICRPKR